MGTYAGYKNTTGDGNSFMGYQAGQANTTGGNNSFVGYRVGYLNTTGSRNSFLGYQAGQANTTGNYNSFLGFRTGYLNTTGSNNVFLGSYAGHLNTTGIQNSFVGNQAGYSNTTGSQNSFLGTYAGYYNQTGSANAIFGNFAGGYDAEGVNSFSSSTIMGYQAGYGLTTGSDNILLGFQSGNSLTTGSNNIIIGYDEDAPTGTTSNHLNIGGIVYGDLLSGNVGIGTASPGALLHVAGNFRQNNIRYYTEQRDLDCHTVGNWTNIGAFSAYGTYAKFKIYGSDGESMVQMVEYEVHATDYPSQTDWIELPLKAGMTFTGTPHFVLDVQQAAAISPLSVRMRAVGLAHNFHATIEIETNTNFTPSSTSGAGATVVAGYLARNAYQFPVSSGRWINSTAGLFITNVGNVGIGTTSPGAKLDVNGNVVIGGSLSYNITRNIVTASRSFWISSDGTTSHIYQNTTNRAMFVSISYQDYGDGGVRAQIGNTIDSVNTTIAGINHGRYEGSAIVGDTIDFIVLSGEYYKVYENSSGDPSIIVWIEYY